MKNRKKHLNLQIIIFLAFIFLFTILLELSITTIIKYKYKINQHSEFISYIEENTINSYNDMLEFYYDDYYVIDTKNTSTSITKITINNIQYNAILTQIINVGDTIHYTIEDNLLVIDSKGSSAIVEKIEYPTNINFLTSQLTNEVNISKLDKRKTSYELNDTLVLYKHLDNYVIIKIIKIDTILFSNINLTQSLMIIVVLLTLLICSYFAYNYLSAPVIEMTEIAQNFNNNNFSHPELEYNNLTHQRLADELNKLGQLLQNYHTEVNAKTSEVNNYIKKSKEEYKFNKQLVANISHEIKTPLAIIQATISAIIDGIFDEDEVQDELNNVLKEIDKTNKMLQEIVDLYKIENNSFELTFETFDLNLLINSKLNNFKKLAQKYNQNIIYNYEEDLMVHADITQISRVINNIIINAITYSPMNNKIIINTKSTKTYILFETINYGVNISNDELKNIFEPFYRLDKSREKSEDHGNGLGLYYVKQMLDKHGFDYGLENVINGVKFYIIFQK